MRILLRALCSLAVAGGCWAGSSTAGSAADLLTVGSAAPVLDIEHWVQDGQGKFKPVTKFESGKVYVVEFWATWCGPCVASMPHLAALQKELAEKGVQIVSISDEDLPTVEKFLEREVRPTDATDAKTYRELTSSYCLTTDPDQSSYQDYMEAAAQNGIPTAFIVGKDAKVEWIGHPMEMDGPLNAVVAGSWDRQAFADELKAQQEAEKLMQEIFALLQKQDFDGALKQIDEAAAKAAQSKGDAGMQLKMLKLQVLIASEKEESAAHLKSLFVEFADQPETLNMVAWNMYEMASQDRIKKGPLIDLSIAACADAVAKTKAEEKASILDTLAHLYSVNEELDKAIQVEEAAAKLAGERDKEFIESFLAELKELKAAQLQKTQLQKTESQK